MLMKCIFRTVSCNNIVAPSRSKFSFDYLRFHPYSVSGLLLILSNSNKKGITELKSKPFHPKACQNTGTVELKMRYD